MKWILSTCVLLTACASPKLPNNQTASDQFYRLGYGEKRIAQNFYQLGEGDAVKRLYWAQRRSQETGATHEHSRGIPAKDLCQYPGAGSHRFGRDRDRSVESCGGSRATLEISSA